MWLPGQIVCDEYEVIRTLGSGGMATVYLLKQLDRNETLAAKQPHACFSESSVFRESLAREVQAWCALPAHPHIAQCRFLREHDDRPVIFTEYVEADTVASWRTSRRLRGLGHVVDIAIQISEALLAAERIQVVHRDVKPSNCLMDKLGRVKVTDFGLADKPTGIRIGDSATPREGANFSGTQQYCSPEQLEGASVDVRSDIWSFGVLMLEVLTGSKPAYGPAAGMLMQDYLTKYAQSGVPAELWDLLAAMFETDRERRPASFTVVGSRLRDIYRLVSGREYDRQFPPPLLGDHPEQTGQSLTNQATRLLRLAMRLNQRADNDADRFRLSLPVQGSGQMQDALAALTISAEAERLLRKSNATKVPSSRKRCSPVPCNSPPPRTVKPATCRVPR